MARQTYTPVFEEAENDIKSRMLESVAPEWDKAEGSFIYDAIAPSAPEVQLLQVQNDEILKNSFAQYAEGDFLDLKLGEVGLTRAQATACQRGLLIEADPGVVIPAGQVLTSVVVDADGNPLEFVVDEEVVYAETGIMPVFATCKTAGVISNIPENSNFVLNPLILGVTSIIDIIILTPGTDKESDDAAYARYDFKVKNPDTGGNKNDYIRWAQDVTGVGKAKCIPLWNGNGTVKVVLLGTDYGPASTDIVTEVQDYLDPGTTGLGDGKAPCGAKVTVIKAVNVAINITATVTWAVGADAVAGKAAFEAAITKYLKDIAFTGQPVVYNKVGSLLITTDGVSNYSGLTVNGGTADVAIGAESVATKGTVTL